MGHMMGIQQDLTQIQDKEQHRIIWDLLEIAVKGQKTGKPAGVENIPQNLFKKEERPW